MLDTGPTIEELAGMMQQEEDRSLRLAIAEALLLLDPVNSFGLVQPLLFDFDSTVRYWVCNLLCDYPTQIAVVPLTQVVMHDGDPDVRALAAVALGKIGDSTALPVLRKVQQQDFAVDYEGETVSSIAGRAIQWITSGRDNSAPQNSR